MCVYMCVCVYICVCVCVCVCLVKYEMKLIVVFCFKVLSVCTALYLHPFFFVILSFRASLALFFMFCACVRS